MIGLNEFSTHPLVLALGWTLLHSIWQGVVIAAGYALAKYIVRRASAQIKYALAGSALLLMLVLPVATFGYQFPGWFNGTTSGGKIPIQAELFAGDELDFASQKLPAPAALATIAETTTITDPNPTLLQRLGAQLTPWLALFWVLGVGVQLSRLGRGLYLIQRLRRVGVSPLPPVFEPTLSKLQQRLNLNRKIQTLVSTLVESPITFGSVKPVILIPASAITGLSSQQLEAILLHELAHIRRHDYLVNWVQSLAEALLFYHPAVWWFSRDIRQEREHCCDDTAVELTQNALEYAQALVALEALRTTHPQPTAAMAVTGGSFMHRIQRLMVHPSPRRPATSALLASICLVFCLMFGFFAVRATSQSLQTTDQINRANRKMAVGFVALPMKQNGLPPGASTTELTRQLVTSLNTAKIPAVGFVQGRQLENGGNARLGELKMWRDAGLELGIGTYSHMWYHGASFDDYTADIEKNEAIVKPLLAERNQQLRLFSYPFLNTGKDLAAKQHMEQFLKDRGYSVMPFTIDNDDWFFAKTYDEAATKGDEDVQVKIREAYLPYMREMITFYEKYSRELFGREIPQVLLLTPSRLNVDCFPQLVEMIRMRGYRFVPMDEATADPAFQTPDTYTGVTGISWLQRWGISRGWEWREEPRPGGIMTQFEYHKGSKNLKAKTEKTTTK
ncbi:MAG: polysaccharide deacetylase family protein [Acidobacteria bacterium]|nr:polysaccharide deacetylase family protein [Acidobacteriota bacterium]